MLKVVTTQEAAQAIGVPIRTLQRWFIEGRLLAPHIFYVGGQKFWEWKRDDLTRASKLRQRLRPGRPREK